MAYGSMAPMMQMAVPNLQQPNPQAQGMALLQAALKQNAPGAQGGGTPPLFGAGGGGTDILNGGMGNGLLSKLFPPTQPTPLAAPGMPPVDPNAPPVVPPLDMGGMGPAPTALTGLW